MAEKISIPGGTYYQYGIDDLQTTKAIVPYQALPMYILDMSVMTEIYAQANRADIGGNLFIPDDYADSNIVWVVFHTTITPLLHESLGYQEWKDFIFENEKLLPVNLQVGNDHSASYRDGLSNRYAMAVCQALNHKQDVELNETQDLALKVHLPHFHRDAYLKDLQTQGTQHLDALKQQLVVDDTSDGRWQVFQQGQRMIQLGVDGGRFNGPTKTRLQQIQLIKHTYGRLDTYTDSQVVTCQDYTNTVDIYCYSGRVEFCDIANTKGLLLQQMGRAFNTVLFDDIDTYEEALDQYLDDDADSDDDVSIFDTNANQGQVEVDTTTNASLPAYVFGNLFVPHFLSNQKWLQYLSFLVYLSAMVITPLFWLTHAMGRASQSFETQQSQVVWLSIVLGFYFMCVIGIEQSSLNLVNVNLAARARSEFQSERMQRKAANYMSWGLRLWLLTGFGLVGQVIGVMDVNWIMTIAIMATAIGSVLAIVHALYTTTDGRALTDRGSQLMWLFGPILGVLVVGYFVMNLIVSAILNN